MPKQQEESLPVQQRWNDDINSFNYLPPTLLGLLQIFLGIFSIALGIGAVCTTASGYYIGYGIWCGILMINAGAFSVIAARYRNSCCVTTTLVMSMIAAACGAVQLSLGILAAVNDARNTRRFTSQTGNLYAFYQYDIYFSLNNPDAVSCSGDTILTFEATWGPVDILLVLVGFVEVVAAVATAIICCIGVCCGLRVVTVITTTSLINEPLPNAVYNGYQNKAGYYNNGYVADNPASRPASSLYRVA